MADREDSDQPRKRIAVACGRCRKRKIRCSGDPGNGGPCSNCKNAGYEPCLFLRVSSQETPLKDTNEYTYNLDAARTYAHARGAVSPLSPLPQYAHEIAAAAAAGDGGLTPYRQSPYPYSSKGYYPTTVPGWGSAYQDDGGVDYGLNYSSYQIINQEPAAPLVSGYGPYGGGGRKSIYVDPETAPSYSYGNLVHRPAVSGDGQGFSLSSMAASLPSASDRLHSSVNRTLTSSSSYRGDALAGHAHGQYGGSKSSSSAATMPDVAYSNLQPSFEPQYATSSALASAIAHRATAHADAAYPAAAVTASDQLYAPADTSIRSADDGLSYVYGDGSSSSNSNGGGGKLGGSRRDSHSGAGPLLSNGHVYVPESHAAHPAPHAYVVPSSSASGGSQERSIDGAASPVGASAGRSGSGSGSGGGGGSSHRPSDTHRRSAGSLRGG